MKYIVPLKGFRIPKDFYYEYINENFLKNADLDLLKRMKRWNNHIPVSKKLICTIGPISEYLRDMVLVLNVFPKYNIPIHADGKADTPENTYNVSINIPVKNCDERVVTHFWDFEDNRDLEYIYLNIPARDIVDKSDLVIKESFVMKDHAVLFRNEWPHSVDNNSDDLRIGLSWRFKPGISWEEAIKLCEEHGLIDDSPPIEELHY